MVLNSQDRKNHAACKNRMASGLGLLAGMLLLCSCAITPRPSAVTPPAELPPDVTMNEDAGRGNWLFVTLRLESGAELPFIVDTGAAVTFFEQSWEPELGKRLGTTTVRNFGSKSKAGRYAAPPLYLGSVRLRTGRHVYTGDLQRISAGPLEGDRFVRIRATVKSTAESAAEFLRSLKEKGQLPGWSEQEQGTMRETVRFNYYELYHERYPESATVDIQRNGDSSTYHYTVGRGSRDSAWKLERAWRTDQNDHTVEEYPVP